MVSIHVCESTNSLTGCQGMANAAHDRHRVTAELISKIMLVNEYYVINCSVTYSVILEYVSQACPLMPGT